jgi:hypothetical protein
LRIEEDLRGAARFAGRKAFHQTPQKGTKSTKAATQRSS